MTAKKFSFPIWLIGTPEQQKAEADRQALALAAHGRGHLSEAERLIGRGALLEATARGNLKAAGKNKEAQLLAKAQLADAVAMQGRFAEAAKIHPDKTRTKHFRSIVKAINRPDEEKCKCKDSEGDMGGVKLSITPRFERAKIFSPVHGDLVSLVECVSCGHQNARPLRSRLLPMQAALSQSEAAKRPIQNDAQVLAVTK